MLDSANLEEIKRIKRIGLLGGLTTNPSIIKRALDEMKYGGRFEELAKEILRYTEKVPCFLQTNGHTAREMTERAKRMFSKLKECGNPHIKVPINPAVLDSHDSFAGIETIQSLQCD